MKKVIICSLKELQWLLRNHQVDLVTSYAIISSSYPLTIPEVSRMRYSFACYDDIDSDCLGRCFSPEAANKFATAIKENVNVKNWYFVCDGGCRRSAGVACSALRFWKREEEELAVWGDPKREPNAWVAVLMSHALGTPLDDNSLDWRIHINRNAIKKAIQRRREC